MDGLQDEISKLQLESLGNDWVDSVYHFEFSDFEDMPSSYESILNSIETEAIFQCLIENIENLEESEENTWTYWAQELNFKKLLAIIGHCIKLGINRVVCTGPREWALLAARLYFKLLSIPGARAYDVYHSQLFANTLYCLSFPKLMCEKSNQFRNSTELSKEVNCVLRALSVYVLDLRAIILQLKLTTDDINFEDILSNLVDVTGGSIIQTLSSVDKIMLSNVCCVIYQVITFMLCNYGEHPNKTAIKLLFKCLTQKLSSVSNDSKVSTSIVRASFVTYAGLVLTGFGKVAVKPFITMLHHLCYDVEERVEIRTTRAEVVVGLMTLLPDRRHRQFVQWVIVLSTTSKMLHRLVALEIISRLLNNVPEINEQRNSIWKEIEKANAVTEALQVISADHSYGRPPAPAADTASVDTEEEEDVLDEEGEDDDEVVGILRSAEHTVPLDCMLEALLDSSIDMFSAVRQRALQVLTESACRDSPHLRRALQALNGCGDGNVGRITAVAGAAARDERAVVRRAALALLLRLLQGAHAAPDEEDFEVLVNLCRDAAITVRAAAIAAVAELLVQRPTRAAVDAFLAGPLPQLADPENKVQDQVKSLIEQIVLKRISKYSAGCAEDPLPWMFLRAVLLRNMRRSLQNACAMLAKTENCINIRLVDVLSSHLGAVDYNRDMLVLLLLTSVADHVHYPDVGFVLHYFYDLISGPKSVELAAPRLRATARSLRVLATELLSAWARFLRAPERAALRDCLVARLADAHEDGCRIPMIVLAMELDTTNLVWADELMHLSEKRAVQTRCLREGMRAADLSLVAPTPPCPALLQLFLAALQDPPPDWEDELAGSSVAAVGRLCMRSRDNARLSAPALAALLRAGVPLPARVNAVYTLQDISARHPCLVEPQLARVCRCLRAAEPARLRRVAVRALTELLLAGFLRLRTPLYYNYCALLADADHDVREPAEYYVTTCLQADVIYQHFVDCVLHYNALTTNPLEFDARQLIYDVMLQRLTPVQKLNTQCRLAREVLAHAAERADDGGVPPALHAALLDAIRLLAGPRMRLPRKPQQTGDTADIDDLQERVTSNIVSHKMKRTVAEVLVPAVMRLYARLAPAGGQLAAYLVMLAQDLEQDYKQEIEELLENDEELMARIAYFRENHNVDSSAGNTRNLVTASGPPEPETPRPVRRRAPRQPARKRTLPM